MKITKEEALELYVRHWPYASAESSDHSPVLTDLLSRVKTWLIDEVSESKKEFCDSAYVALKDENYTTYPGLYIKGGDSSCSSCPCGNTDCTGDDDDDDDSDDQEVELELPVADLSVNPEDLHHLPSVVATLPSNVRSKIEFEELDAGPVDLVVEDQGDIIKNISHVLRDAGQLSIFNDEGWTSFDVKKFPKAWTALLSVGKIYAVER